MVNVSSRGGISLPSNEFRIGIIERVRKKQQREVKSTSVDILVSVERNEYTRAIEVTGALLDFIDFRFITASISTHGRSLHFYNCRGSAI